MNKVLNLFKAEDGIVNFVSFIKFSRLSHLGIYLTLFLQSKRAYVTRNDDEVPHFKVKQLFQNFFLPFDYDRVE